LVYRIKAEDVHLRQGYVFNPHGRTKAARRKIPLTARAAEVLRQRMAAAESDHLFPHENVPDKTMIKANNAHYGALRRSGLDHFRPYDLRHTFATRAVESGVDLVTLAALLGHRRIQMVMRYAHPSASHQVDAMRKLESFTRAREMEVFGAGIPAMVN